MLHQMIDSRDDILAFEMVQCENTDQTKVALTRTGEQQNNSHHSECQPF